MVKRRSAIRSGEVKMGQVRSERIEKARNLRSG